MAQHEVTVNNLIQNFPTRFYYKLSYLYVIAWTMFMLRVYVRFIKCDIAQFQIVDRRVWKK